MSIGEKIAAARKAKGWTQEKLAEMLEISVQAVSAWETGKSEPDKEHIRMLAELPGLSLTELIADGDGDGWEYGSPYFDPDHMYTFVKTKAMDAGLTQTLAALPLMREKHGKTGQTRESNYGFEVPYRVHPLTLACHALAMGIGTDDVLAAALLHDVVEDTGTRPEDLPEAVGDSVRETVRLLSYNTYLEGENAENPDRKDEIKPAYYEGIRNHPLAALVKCLDRCNNLSCMADGFTREKMRKYVKQTEEYVLPLLEAVKDVPEWNSAAWLLKYQMTALLETFKRLL